MAGLATFHASLLKAVKNLNQSYEVIYCDDGSTDNTASLVRNWHNDNRHIRLVRLSRNFGKEAALAAGIAQSNGQAIIMLDGDGQHPVEIIPEFINKWQEGAKVVIGIRTGNSGEGSIKRQGSKLFYTLFNHASAQQLIPGSTDFRLIDISVRKEFLKLHENDRLTRGLIDWLGFDRTYVHFKAMQRVHGKAAYNNRKLLSLATNSFVSLTATPLYIFGYIGIVISTLSLVLGSTIIIEQLILNDPLSWDFTGTAMLGILLVFLVGLVLMSQGILSLYISHIHTQSKQRPLYIIDEAASSGINKEA